jgi:hypothetical protein
LEADQAIKPPLSAAIMMIILPLGIMWVCLMCASTSEIETFIMAKEGSGWLGRLIKRITEGINHHNAEN